MSQELDELSERYSTLLAEATSGTHITWVGARDVLRRAVREAYELGQRYPPMGVHSASPLPIDKADEKIVDDLVHDRLSPHDERGWQPD